MKWTLKDVMYNPDVQKEFSEAYKEAFGKKPECESCPSILNREYFKLRDYYEADKQTQIIMSQSNFILKPGKLISYNGNTYSENFMPEEVAIELLTNHPEKFRDKFKTINEDLLGKKPKKAEKEETTEVNTEETPVEAPKKSRKKGK